MVPLRGLTLSMLFTSRSTSYQTTCTVSERSSIKGTHQCKPTSSSSFALQQYSLWFWSHSPSTWNEMVRQEVSRCCTRGCRQRSRQVMGIHLGFETQRRCHQKSKTGVSVASQKGPMSSKKIHIPLYPIKLECLVLYKSQIREFINLLMSFKIRTNVVILFFSLPVKVKFWLTYWLPIKLFDLSNFRGIFQGISVEIICFDFVQNYILFIEVKAHSHKWRRKPKKSNKIFACFRTPSLPPSPSRPPPPFVRKSWISPNISTAFLFHSHLHTYCMNYSLNNRFHCKKQALSHLLFGQLLGAQKSSIMGCIPIFCNCVDWKVHA